MEPSLNTLGLVCHNTVWLEHTPRWLCSTPKIIKYSISHLGFYIDYLLMSVMPLFIYVCDTYVCFLCLLMGQFSFIRQIKMFFFIDLYNNQWVIPNCGQGLSDKLYHQTELVATRKHIYCNRTNVLFKLLNIPNKSDHLQPTVVLVCSNNIQLLCTRLGVLCWLPMTDFFSVAHFPKPQPACSQ